MALDSLLHSTFGFSAFRANQEAVCRAATEGHDVLLVMPTGAGKSLCYQLPAIARGGTGLVISPLIALMDDQAAKLSALGLRVARIHSGLSRDDSRQACRDYLDGTLQFLFIAPERLRVPGFPELLAKRKPSLIAIDEAHCISAWGHDFRPDYRLLGDYLSALRPSPVIALTATATPTVQRDIVAQLHLKQPQLFIHGFRRDNLGIEVMELSKPQRLEFTTKFLSDESRRPAIVYAPSRKAAEEIAAELGRRFPAAAYHAGLEPGVRERVQTQFLGGKLQCVVATIAFGMGIDKADVRTVIHYALPASVEAYYQEIGRAGRDGKPSRTVLLYSFADRKMHDFFLERDYPLATELKRVAKLLTEEFQPAEEIQQKLKMPGETFARALEKLAANGAASLDFDGNVRRAANPAWQTAYEAQVEFRRNQIDAMMAYANTQQCRMSALIRHFGDTADGLRPCGHCDFCAPSAASAQSFTEPSSLQERHLWDILGALEGGSKSSGRLFTDLALPIDRNEFEGLVDGVARAGLVNISQETFTNPDGKVIAYKRLSLTHEGNQLKPGDPLGVVLRAAAPTSQLKLPSGKSSAKSKAKTPKTPSPAMNSAQQELEARLRAWRKAEAAKTGKPAFIVCSDAALAAVAVAAPTNLQQLLTVAGFGPDKAERYGAEICAICRNELPPPAIEAAPARAVRNAEAEFKPRPAPDPRPVAANPQPRPEPFQELTPAQHALDARLREWRKAESEKLGLPQFFVLGTTALRSVVVIQPKTLKHLEGIQGIGPEKARQFGSSILEILHG